MNKIDNPYSKEALKIYAITIFFYTISYTVLAVLPFYATMLGASKSVVGLIMGASMFTSMIFRPIAGKIIDHFGVKKVTVFSLGLFSLSLFGYFIPNVAVFGLVRIIQGVVAAFFSTAMQMHTMNILSERLRGQGVSLYSLSTMIPATFGPVLGLYLKDYISFNIIFLILFAIGVATFIFGLWIPIQENVKINRGRILSFPKKEEVKQKDFLIPSILMCLISISNGAIFTFVPLYFEQKEMEFAKSYFLIQTVVLALSRFVLGKYVPSDGKLAKRLTAMLISMVGMGTLLLAYNPRPITLVLSAVLNGIAYAMIFPTLLTFISFKVTNSQEKGFLIGLFIAFADLGYAFGAFGMGKVADLYGFSWMYGFCTLISALSLCILLTLNQNKKHSLQTYDI